MYAAELGEAVKRKRRQERRTQVGLGRALGVSGATISRIERGIGGIDTPTLCRLNDWLDGAKPGAPVVYFPTDTTPNIVAAHLRVDPMLSPHAANLLDDLFRFLYERLTL